MAAPPFNSTGNTPSFVSKVRRQLAPASEAGRAARPCVIPCSGCHSYNAEQIELQLGLTIKPKHPDAAVGWGA